MEELSQVENLTQDDVLDLITEFPVTPLKDKCVVSINTYEPDGNIVLADNSMDEVQFVLSTGSFVKDIKPGAKVILDLEGMTKVIRDEETGETTPRISLKPLEVNGRVYALLSDRYIDAIDNR